MNIDIDRMLDIGWELMAKNFEPDEIGLKEEIRKKYWK